MNLEEFKQSIKESRNVTEDKLTIGSLIITILSTDDGLVFKNSQTEKPKRLVVVGFDNDKKLIYGAVLVNTKMSPKAAYSDEFMSAQYLLKQDNYPDFLDYDSYVDCGELFALSLEKLITGRYCGCLTEEDKEYIFHILETTETLTTKEKKRFGIRRR